MKRIFSYISYLTVALAFLIISLVIFWSVYPYNPLVLSNVKLDRTEVNRGEHIRISADYCKNTDKGADLFISFIDGVVYNTPPQIINLEKGCHHTVLSVYIPKALPTGEFQLKGVFKYKLNPIREIEVNQLSGEFTIIQ